MQVAIESSHLSGDYSSGLLELRILRQHESQPAPPLDVYFSVPPDFHTHNDSVAAAAMTLVGRQYQHVQFNFPISTTCAQYLRRYYVLADIGPIDPGLASRAPGSRIGLNFSGGMDSTLLWLILHTYTRCSVAVITTEYEGFAREIAGFRDYHRDVTSRTNLRSLRLDQQGRFHFAVPLLFSDYLDLGAIATGHTFDHFPRSLESMRDGRRPNFLLQEPSLLAGGLRELHLLRGIFELASPMGIVRAAPERLQRALTAGGMPNSRKHAMKALTARYTFETEGLTVPDYLRDIVMPLEPKKNEGIGWRALWMIKRLGPDVAHAYDWRVTDDDVRFASELELTFLERYNTNLAAYIPRELRRDVLRGFFELGYQPYTERDFDELQIVREFLERQGRVMETPLPE